MSESKRAAKPRGKRPARIVFGSTVLWSEVFVVFFAFLVAYGLRIAPTNQLALIAAIGIVFCAVSAQLQRSKVLGIVTGTVAQVVMILGGLIVPMMYTVGVIFALLWFLGLWLGLKIDRERREREA